MAYSFFLIANDRRVQFPIAPSSLNITVQGRNETIELMNEGEVNLLKSPGLTEVSFTALIPQVGRYPFAVVNEPIDTYVHFLNRMIEYKQPFQFVVIRTNGTKLLFDTNLKMACEGYEMKESAENGFDIELDIKLKQYRDFGVKTVAITKVTTTTQTTTTTSDMNTRSKATTTKSKATASTKTKRDTKTNAGKKHTIKRGDTLWSISKKYYGSGAKWKTIYTKNKSTIEAAAKKHGKKSSSTGHWIYPGTVLIIP